MESSVRSSVNQHIPQQTILHYIYTYIHTYIHTYTNTQSYINTHTHVHTYTHTYTYTNIHIHTYIHVHAYIHTYIHTYINTYIVIWSLHTTFWIIIFLNLPVCVWWSGTYGMLSWTQFSLTTMNWITKINNFYFTQQPNVMHYTCNYKIAGKKLYKVIEYHLLSQVWTQQKSLQLQYNIHPLCEII